MERVLLLLMAVAIAAGCQAQNPFAAFGPPRVPAPTTSQTPPYYSPTTNGPQRPPPGSSLPNQRLSVSAEGNSLAQAPRTSFVADPVDREPIRIVENPAAVRTAAAPGRGVTPDKIQTPPANPPKLNAVPRMQPPAGGASGNRRADGSVVPASYQQPAATFIETPTAAGQWRAR